MEERKIGHLKKVTLSLEAGTAPQVRDLTPEGARLQFIYGLGTHGLTPLELALADKTVGDEVLLMLGRQEIPQVFQHLILPPFQVPERVESLYLRIRILNIETADQREVIKALAEMAHCADPCCGH